MLYATLIMKKLIYSATSILIVCFTFCKKKEATPAPAATASTSSTTTGTTNIYTIPAGLVASTGGNFCDLKTTYIFVNNGGTIIKDSVVEARFYTEPLTAATPTLISGGTVTLNGTNVPFQTNFYTFIGSSPINLTSPLNWSVSGSGTVTAFSQSFTPSYPQYTGGNLLPDTCIKANGITMNVSGVSNNQSGVIVQLYSGANYAFKYYLGTNGSVTFSAAELSSFTINNPLTIAVSLTNVYSATLGGIKRGFTNSLQYSKFSYLK